MAEVFIAWPKLTAGAAVPSQLAPRLPWLCLKSVEITSGAPCPPDFYVRAEIMISGSRGLVWQELYMPSHGPAPGVELFTQHWASIAANLFFFSINHTWSLRSGQFWEIILFLDTSKLTMCSLDQKQNIFTGKKKCSTWLFLVICTIKLCTVKPNT